ncbi:alpha/beta fold hydrolase [Streptosporangium lutulentum]
MSSGSPHGRLSAGRRPGEPGDGPDGRRPGRPAGSRRRTASACGLHRAEDEGRRRRHQLRARGHGKTLVLLHGYPQTWYTWREVLPELAKHYTVIAPDLRGAGKSDAPAAATTRRPSPRMCTGF